MSATIATIMDFMEQLAPASLAEESDNVGLLVGNSSRSIDKVLLALDATPAVIQEAIDNDCSLIITHHPFFRYGLKSINDTNVFGKKLLSVLEGKIAIFCAHTNLDKTNGGVNDCICDKLQLTNVVISRELNGNNGFMRIGSLKEPERLETLAHRCKDVFSIPYLPFVGDGDTIISKVAVVGGNGMSLINEAISSGVDLFVSGDIRYHDAQLALENNLCMLDLTHYGSEVVVIPPLSKYLTQKCSENNISLDILVSKINAQPFKI